MIYSFGSLNMDLVCQTPRLPRPGETLLGQQFTTVPGGKGANQAVAVARLGVPTTMIGRVGNDGFGHSLINSLNAAGVAAEAVVLDTQAPTGVALIVVDNGGQNQIVVVPGANGLVGDREVQSLRDRLRTGDGLLLQLEVPLVAVQQATQVAQDKGATVILDPAPAPAALPDDLMVQVDWLTPNQTEASQLVGFAVTDVASAWAAAQILRQRGPRCVIIKLGEQGAVVATPTHGFHQPALAVHAVDTVAAGDAFNGGLAAGLIDGLSPEPAVQWATTVAAYAVTQRGAQRSMPTRSQVDALLAQVPVARPL
ncbi:ribokinase [Phormidium sp. FACHB-1136]|uniref:ribokinase n=1 Tax=Phormidium sp. FACHB-1136 TaxID=2692848 RepID=UPI001685285B|nr:ribokinase [Phormidium sp. FACHB-1136]MBD2425788.1 ribokinase [Phormidium sp. FACHB-1136]